MSLLPEKRSHISCLCNNVIRELRKVCMPAKMYIIVFVKIFIVFKCCLRKCRVVRYYPHHIFNVVEAVFREDYLLNLINPPVFPCRWGALRKDDIQCSKGDSFGGKEPQSVER